MANQIKNINTTKKGITEKKHLKLDYLKNQIECLKKTKCDH